MKKIVFVIMDGVGIKDDINGNAFMKSSTPNLDYLMHNGLYTTLFAHGPYVGLPGYDDMGNSEVGHNAMGCGQIYSQGAKLVNEAIESKELFRSKIWQELVSYSKNTTMHFIGLLSDGNVHSHINHLLSMLEEAKNEGIKRVCVHVLLDGRDVEPKSALKYIDMLENKMKELNDDNFNSLIASGGGRMYITMDRYEADWDMVKRGWYTHVLGDAPKYHSATEAILNMREADDNLIDQNLGNFVIVDDNDNPIGKINDGDSVIFFNFRGDRAIEISLAFDSDESFNKFDRIYVPKVKYAGMLQYDADKGIPLKYLTEPPKIKNTLTEELCKYNIREYAISETQKYGHVTYFWNGNRLEKFDDKLETWELVPSDNISFDKAPKMKAHEITDKLIDAIKSNKYDFLRINYPNGDMVGHTGDFDATVEGVNMVDESIGRIIKNIDEDTILVVTADHGNCEEMLNKDGTPKTSHTVNKVPFIIYGNVSNIKIKDGEFGLANIASTIATLFDIKPNDSWLESIIEKDNN